MYRFRLWAPTLTLGCVAFLVADDSAASTRILRLGLNPIPGSGSCPQAEHITIDGLRAENHAAEIVRGDKVRWLVTGKHRAGDWTITWKDPASKEWDHFEKDEPHSIKRGSSSSAHHETGPPDPKGAPPDRQWYWSYDIALDWPKSDDADCAQVAVDPKLIISSSSGTAPIIFTDLLTAALGLLVGLGLGYTVAARRARRRSEHKRPDATH